MFLHTLLPPAAFFAVLSGGASEPPEAVEDSLSEEIIQAQKQVDQRLTVPVSIGGVGPFRFLVDTGAQATVVTHRVSDKLGPLPRGRAMLVAMASRRSVETVEIDGLTLGSRTFDHITAPLLDFEHVGADGILGLDSLQYQRVMMDFTTNTMTVSDAKSQGGTRGFEIVVRARRKLGQLVITNALVNGIRTDVMIDTGSQTSIGNMALKRRMQKKGGVDSLITDVHGMELMGKIAVARNIRIDAVDLSNVPINFAEAPVFAALGLSKRPALIMGMRDLMLFKRVAIDFSSRKILFDLPRSAERSRFSRIQ